MFAGTSDDRDQGFLAWITQNIISGSSFFIGFLKKTLIQLSRNAINLINLKQTEQNAALGNVVMRTGKKKSMPDIKKKKNPDFMWKCAGPQTSVMDNDAPVATTRQTRWAPMSLCSRKLINQPLPYHRCPFIYTVVQMSTSELPCHLFIDFHFSPWEHVQDPAALFWGLVCLLSCEERKECRVDGCVRNSCGWR